MRILYGIKSTLVMLMIAVLAICACFVLLFIWLPAFILAFEGSNYSAPAPTKAPDRIADPREFSEICN